MLGNQAPLYHLAVLLALGIASSTALLAYRENRTPDQRRLVISLLTLSLLRLPPAIGSIAQIAPLIQLTPPLEVMSLALLWWLSLYSLLTGNQKRLFVRGNIILLLILGGLALLGVSLPPSVWNLWALALSLSAFVLLLRSLPAFSLSALTTIPLPAFLFLSLGNMLLLFGQKLLGYLLALFGYAIIPITIHQAALNELWGYRQELEVLSASSLRQTRELVSMIEIARLMGQSRDLKATLEHASAWIAEAINADRVAIFTLKEETLRLIAQYPPPHSRTLIRIATELSFDGYPYITSAIRGQEQIILNSKNNYDRLSGVYALLGSQEAGPAIIQPLMHKGQILGVLFAGNDRSETPFSSNEARICHSVAAPVSAAIDSTRLYQRLARSLQALEKEAGQREAILESIAEGVIVIDLQGRAAMMNAAAEAILETQRERVLGRPLGQALKALTRKQKTDLGRLSQAADPLTTLFDLAGKQIQVNAAPVRTAMGDHLGMVAVLRDVTQEVQAEQAKREFISSISHELRTPLTAILGYTEALVGGMAGELTETQAHFVEIIHKNTRHMIGMANNLIALSEAERGDIELEYSELDLYQFLPEILDSFSAELEQRQITGGLDLADTLPLLWADPHRLRLAIANLIDNAIRFTLPGGEVTIGAALRTLPAGEMCAIWVQDTGIGIPPQEQERVWERFYRAPGPLEIEAGGLGIGLFITRSLVQAHGGQVHLDSTPGKGSRFTLLIPTTPP